ncbi:MAG: hypothetical protein KJ622_03730 [Alphaproteobacteria bacterium]|nr:hypothetical protein [Alphaproteobacteria bacterium]
MLDKRIRDLLNELKKAGHRQHPAFSALEDLFNEIADDKHSKLDQLKLYHRYAGLPGQYVDVVKGRKLYRQWCRKKGVVSASLSRNGHRDEHGKKCDPPCLEYLAEKLGVSKHAVWRVRNELTK